MILTTNDPSKARLPTRAGAGFSLPCAAHPAQCIQPSASI